MPEPEPAMEVWGALFDAALRFKEVGCWNWMWDSDLFGVQNQTNGEIGYCCVMGRNREHFALAVYLGTEGLEKYMEIQAGEVDAYSTDMLFYQKCLMVSFEDRKFLREKDFEIIKKLGLNFRGKNSWPLFRSYVPGFFPWHLTNSEADFLLDALQQTIDVALRFKKEKGLFDPPRGKDDCYLVQVPKNVNGALVWGDQWILPPELSEPEIAQVPNASAIVKEIKNYAQQQAIWEIDSFYNMEPIKEGEERPFYPRQILFVDHIHGAILHFQLLTPSQNFSNAIGEEFLNAVKSHGFFPKEILVANEEIAELLETITAELGIRLMVTDELPEIQRARDGISEFFGSH